MRAATHRQLADWIDACAGGDRDAFAALYRATSPNLYAVLVRILQREDWAQEVLQEVYMTVWNGARGYRRGRAAPNTWLTRIARNRAIDRLRRERPALGDGEFAFEQVVDDAAEAEPELARSEQAAAVRRCLGTLPSRQAECIRIAFFEGLTYNEVAVRVGAPLGSVKTWIRRGLASIRQCLED